MTDSFIWTPKKVKHRGFEIVNDEHRKHKIETIKLPERSTIGSAGYDFYLAEDIKLNPFETRLSFSDVKAYMKPDEVLKMYIRSSVANKRGIIILNSVGIIDHDYYSNPDNDGNIAFLLYNIGKTYQYLTKGEKIAQGIFQKYLTIDNDDVNMERKGGIGSTGV